MNILYALLKFLFYLNALLFITSYLNNHFHFESSNIFMIFRFLVLLVPFFVIPIGLTKSVLDKITYTVFALMLFYFSMINGWFLDLYLTYDIYSPSSGKTIRLKDFNFLIGTNQIYFIAGAFIMTARFLIFSKCSRQT